jgi:hypothetical protein
MTDNPTALGTATTAKVPTALPVRGGMTVDAYAVLVDCVERGVVLGWNHAHKHVSDPSPDAIQQHIVDDVLSAISEYFNFDLPEI